MKLLRLLFALPDFAAGFARALLRHNDSALAAYLRRRMAGGFCEIDTAVTIRNRRHFQAGAGSALYHGTYILNTHGRFVLGEDSHLGAGCFVNAVRGNVVIGSHVAIGPGTRIFSYSNHYRAHSLVTAEKLAADVEIGDNVFLGAGCAILPGSRIGNNVVVGAGSVVKGLLTSDAIYAGSPCRRVRAGWFAGVEGGGEPPSLPATGEHEGSPGHG